MLEKRTEGDAVDDNGTVEELVRYIYSNHLQSASLELDEDAEIISYEEYHPYGTTSYQAMNASVNAVAKRYRYTGKERDEESGLYYHGARYYIPWLCQWSAVDPLESDYAGMSPYNYGFNNPVVYNDPSGMEGEDEVNMNRRQLADGSWQSYSDEYNAWVYELDTVEFVSPRQSPDHPFSYSMIEAGKKGTGIALNGASLIIPEKYTMAREKGSMYVLALLSPEGETFKWNDEAKWYVSESGNYFDNPWYEDIFNYIQSSVQGSVGQLAKDALEKGNPFFSIGESYDNYKSEGGGYGVVGFVGSGIKSSLVGTYEDLKYGGQRRTNALIGIWQFSAAVAKSSYLLTPSRIVNTGSNTLRHYTSEAGYNAIMESKELLPSIGIKNARHGAGQYFTDLTSGYTSGQVSRRLFGVPWNTKKLTHFIDIDVSGLNG